MNWTFLIIEIISLIVTIISLIVTCVSIIATSTITGISVYLLYKARTSPYGEAIYSKQIEGYVELSNAISEAGMEGIRFLINGGLKTEKGEVLYSQTLGKLLDLDNKCLKWAILLPREIASLIVNFTEENKRILDLPFNEEENKELIGNVLVKTLNKIRDAVGVEPLSEEILKLIKKIKS